MYSASSAGKALCVFNPATRQGKVVLWRRHA